MPNETPDTKLPTRYTFDLIPNPHVPADLALQEQIDVEREIHKALNAMVFHRNVLLLKRRLFHSTTYPIGLEH